MTEKRNRLDSNSIVSKLKELILILIFTLIAVVVAIILSDILVFPLTCYSINNIDIFNIAFKYAFISFITVTFLLLLFLKVRSLYKDGNSARYIIGYIISRTIQCLVFILLLVLIVWAIPVMIINSIFSKNYSLLVGSSCSLLFVFAAVGLAYKFGHPASGTILVNTILKPAKYLGFFLLSLILAGGLIAILYIIFSNNYYLLYKLSGGI